MAAVKKESSLHGLGGEDRYRVNLLARHQQIERLYTDILLDIQICRIEGWDHREYIRMVREMLDKLPK